MISPSRNELDLSSFESINDFLTNLSTSIDILVNNAGILKVGQHNELSSVDFHEILQVNVIAPFVMMSKLSHSMKENKYGRIVNVSSIWSQVSRDGRSIYSASKAASDHLVRAYYKTYGIPVLTTNCSNNYGPFQFPEKLIPLTIQNALQIKDIPIYGDGQQIRDWLYVGDHCSAIRHVLEEGNVGDMYNVGGCNEKTNLEVANTICEILDELQPRLDGDSYKSLIKFVKDRPGHDKRYAINATKIEKNLNWKPTETIETGIQKTV